MGGRKREFYKRELRRPNLMLVKINIYKLKFWHSDKQVIYIHYI